MLSANTHCSYASATARRLVCEETITQPSGFIHSSDLDNGGKYDIRHACVWKLTAEKGQRIYLRFLEFEMKYTDNCNYDFVEIREVCLYLSLSLSF